MLSVPPRVKEESAMVGLPVGQNVTLRCMVEASPSPIIYWVRGNPGEAGDVPIMNKWVCRRKNTSCVQGIGATL